MFRFMALAWDPADPGAVASARPCTVQLRSASIWQTALQTEGLAVFTTGTGANQTYRCGSGAGVVLGRLFARDEQHAHRSSAAPRIEALDVVARDGKVLVQDHWGRYVAFFIDARGVTVIRDPSGALPCFVLQHGAITLIFSWLEDAIALCDGKFPLEISIAALGAWMTGGEFGSHLTCLHGITQVLPGQRLRIGPNGTRTDLLWNAVALAAQPSTQSIDEATELLRVTVRACTQTWAACHKHILLRLSGGIDSSILVSCLAADDTSAAVTCVNYHSPGPDGDERLFARLAAQMSGRPLIERARDEGFDLAQILDVALTPAPSPHVGRMSPARMDAALARSIGADALFTGGGGDQLFLETHRWWPLADYLRLRGVDRGFATAALDAAALGRVSVLRAIRLALQDRFRRASPALDVGPRYALTTDLLQTAAGDADRFRHPALREAGALPIGKLMQTQQLMYPAAYYDPFLREAAPETVNPLLSQPLVELVLSLPTYQLTTGGRPRGLARKAFADDMPRAIARRRSKGSMWEHIQSVLIANLRFARELLLDGEMVRLGLLDRQKTQAALGAPDTEIAGMASELHMHLTVEAWLRRARALSARAR